MSKFERNALCVHGHFSQPSRGHPINYTIGEEADAAPYFNWNERVNETSYKPNALIGNFDKMSFSISEALMRWLESDAPEVYQRIIESEREAFAAHQPAGNALATAYNHIILPLARKRDKVTQVMWGLATFERHFGRKALGFWLPEIAIDTESLLVLADAGVEYIILTEKQVKNLPAQGGAGPYWVDLPNGRRIGAFVRNDKLSSDLSFNVHNLGGAGLWCRNELAIARKTAGTLTLLATAGETFGHHHAGEEQFLYWLLSYEAKKAGFEITTLDQQWLTRQPTQSIEVEERTSWGDFRGLTEWATGGVHKDKDTTWKGALRRALDNATSDLDTVYEALLRPYKVDPWKLRNAYLPALFKGATADDYIHEFVPGVSAEDAAQLAASLHAQRLTQRMYNSYTFTDNQLDGRQPRYAVACAATALSLVQEATGKPMLDRFPLDLAVVTSANSEITGTDMLQDAVKSFGLKVE